MKFRLFQIFYIIFIPNSREVVISHRSIVLSYILTMFLQVISSNGHDNIAASDID